MLRDTKYLFSLVLSLGLISPSSHLYASDKSDLGIALPSVQVNSDVIDALRVYEARKKLPVGLGSAISVDPQLQQHFVNLADPWVNPDTLPAVAEVQVEDPALAPVKTKENKALSEEEMQRFVEAAESYKAQIAKVEQEQQLEKALEDIDQAVSWDALEPSAGKVHHTELEKGDYVGPRQLVKPVEAVVAEPWVNPDDVTEVTMQGWAGLVEVSEEAEEVASMEEVVDEGFIESQRQEIAAMVERSVPEIEGNTIQVVSQWQNPDVISVEQKEEAILEEKPQVVELPEVKQVNKEEVAGPPVVVRAFIPTPYAKPVDVPVRPEILAAQAKQKAEEEARKNIKASELAKRVQGMVEQPLIPGSVSGFFKESLEVTAKNLDKAKKQQKQVAVRQNPVVTTKDRVKEAIADSKAKIAEVDEVEKEFRHAIAFEVADTVLKEGQKKALAASLAEHLRKGNKQYRIIGYAYDHQQGGYSARRVSLQRAIAIRNFLIKSGVDSVKINVQIVSADAGSSGGEKVEVVVR